MSIIKSSINPRSAEFQANAAALGKTVADLREQAARVSLPGGLGTFEELFEILTWAQLGFHSKPVGLLNVDAYYQPLVQMMERGVAEGFMKAENRGLLLVEDNAQALLRTMGAYHPPAVGKRIRDEKLL